MTTRTVQIWGQGYAPTGTEPIVITATFNGNVVYTGNIPTQYTSDVGRLPTDQAVLFTFEIPMDLAGTVPMNVSLDSPVGVDAFFEQIQVNYAIIANPQYNASDLAILENPASTQAEKIAVWEVYADPPLSPADIDVLTNGTMAEQDPIIAAHGLRVEVSSGAGGFENINGTLEPRSNVVINDVPQTRGTDPAAGAWGWEVEFPAENSGTFACDITVVAGKE